MAHFDSPALDPAMAHTGLGSMLLILLLVLVLWTLIWKGFALWYSARNGQKIWFVVLLILSTLGILDIIYLAFFRTKAVVKTISSAEVSNISIVEEVVIDG